MRPDGDIPDMGARVTNANHLGELLTQSVPRPATPVRAYQHLIDHIANCRGEILKHRTLGIARREVAEVHEPTEFQDSMS